VYNRMKRRITVIQSAGIRYSARGTYTRPVDWIDLHGCNRIPGVGLNTPYTSFCDVLAILLGLDA